MSADRIRLRISFGDSEPSHQVLSQAKDEEGRRALAVLLMNVGALAIKNADPEALLGAAAGAQIPRRQSMKASGQASQAAVRAVREEDAQPSSPPRAVSRSAATASMLDNVPSMLS